MSSRVTRSINPVLAPVSAVKWQPMDPETRQETGMCAIGTWQQERNTLSLAQYSSTTPHLTSSTSIHHTGDVTDMTWCGDDIITSNNKGTVYIYRVVGMGDTDMKSSSPSTSKTSSHSLSLTHTFPLHHGPCTCLAISPNPSHPILATSGEDGSLHTISLSTHTVTHSIQHVNTSSTLCMAWNGIHTLVMGGMNGRLLLWDWRVTGGKPVSVAVDSNSVALTSLAVHTTRPDTIATGSTNGIVSLWDIRQNSTPMCSLQAHTGPIWDILFFPSQPTTILTCGEDGAIASWDFNATRGDASRVTFSSIDESNIIATRLFESDTSVNSMDVNGDGVVMAGTDSETVVFLQNVV